MQKEWWLVKEKEIFFVISEMKWNEPNTTGVFVEAEKKKSSSSSYMRIA